MTFASDRHGAGAGPVVLDQTSAARGARRCTTSCAGHADAADDAAHAGLLVGPSGSRVTRTWTGSATVGAFISNYKINADNPMGDIVWTAR